MGYTKRMEHDPLDERDDAIDALWDELLASEESQKLLLALMMQALVDDAAGETLDLDELLESVRADEPCE